jgi:tetratricopeptide (TPR) repeat protein
MLGQKNMSTQIEQIKTLRKEQRYKEACELAHELIASDDQNADLWWNLALAQHSLGRNQESISSVKSLLKLAPSFASGWAHYGVVLAADKQVEQGLKALSHALQLEPDHSYAARQAALICRESNDSEGEIRYLTRLEAMGQANGNDLNQIGIAYWKKKHFEKAIDYYRRSAAILESSAPYFNLSVAYIHGDISQDIDAIDCLERALLIDPNYQKAYELLNTIKPRLENLASAVLADRRQTLLKEEWYQFYINPFELLGANREDELENYDTKRVQKLKKRVLHEIELEDGRLYYLEGIKIDKSRVIGICEELNDENLKEYHWLVFSEPYLLGFLTRGDIRHFLCLEEYKPQDLLDELDSEWSGFREWLSMPFSRQYDLVLTRALQNNRISLVESLFDGRRWIMREHEDSCFQGARRQVEQLLDQLREQVEQSKNIKPTLEKISEVVEISEMISIFNLLPQPFRDQQSEAVSLIRDIAITAINQYNDSDLSRDILSLTNDFIFESSALTQRLEEDFEQIDKLIEEERMHEAKFIQGSSKMEVTKDGVRHGEKFCSADNIFSIRWGVTINGSHYNQIHNYFMLFCDNAGNEIEFFWKSADNTEGQHEIFRQLVNAAVNYIIPKIYEKIKSNLDVGREVKIGPCSLSKNFLSFSTSGWFSDKKNVIPWSRVENQTKNGTVTIYDTLNSKTRVDMEISETENAAVLPLVALIMKQS